MTPRNRLVVVLCTLLALAGCGGSDDGATPSPSSSPTKAPLTAAEAKTVAAAGILTAADMPGYTAQPAEAEDPEDAATEAAFRTCIGSPARDYLVSDPGREFTKGDLEVSSSVDVARTAAIAKAEFDAYTGPKASDCAKAQFTKIFQEEGATVTGFTVTPVTVTVPGSDGAFGQEFSIDLSADGQTLRLRGLELGALVGQVEVSISTFGTPTATLSLADAQALLVKATDRVKAAV